jgi:hypothetical protein
MDGQQGLTASIIAGFACKRERANSLAQQQAAFEQPPAKKVQCAQDALN